MAAPSDCALIEDATKKATAEKKEMSRHRHNSNGSASHTIDHHEDDYLNENDINTNHDLNHDAFEKAFDDSMENLEDADDSFDSSDSDSDTQPVQTPKKLVIELPRKRKTVRVRLDNTPLRLPPGNDNQHIADSDTDEDIEDDDDADDDDDDDDDNDDVYDEKDEIISAINKSPKLMPLETANNKLFFFRPYLLPFQERRRLSQCKEEDDEYEDGDRQHNHSGSSSQTAEQRHADRLEKLDKLHLNFTKSASVNLSDVEKEWKKLQPSDNSQSPAIKVIKGKFTVTKTEEETTKQLRPEAEMLKDVTAKQNAATISFPCSSSAAYASIRGLFSPQGNLTPHLDKKFFDTSLVEIRSVSSSTKSLDKSSDNKIDRDNLDEVWIPRPKIVDEQDGANKAGLSSRPSSAPAEPNAKAARKASKKMEKEARRQEKEKQRNEKEARKIERETARRLEREAAKLEKITRNTEKMSRSTERVASRSGSLERRRSGDDTTPVLNQSTVHGIASPNRRPTIFDVFRPRTKSDARRRVENKEIITKSSGSDKDNSSTSSNHSGSGGGIMQAMKTAVQNTVIGHKHSTAAPKYKDGSAHPHAGSDAQYYHTVTAVRRADVSRSPMTKVMDLFRHRSNSAVSEADKRKARAAAHQQQIAAQSILQQSEFGKQLLWGNLPLPKNAPLPNTDISFPYYFVADAAFPLKENIMRPYPGKKLTKSKEVFNYRLSRARRTIENAFGILVARWRILKTTLHLLPENAEKIVLATIALHNFIKINDRSETYMPPMYMDCEDSNHGIHLGGWRKEVVGLRSYRPGANNAKRQAFRLRDTLKDFFQNAGAVPFQNR